MQHLIEAINIFKADTGIFRSTLNADRGRAIYTGVVPANMPKQFEIVSDYITPESSLSLEIVYPMSAKGMLTICQQECVDGSCTFYIMNLDTIDDTNAEIIVDWFIQTRQ